jgi:hypothetical protein
MEKTSPQRQLAVAVSTSHFEVITNTPTMSERSFDDCIAEGLQVHPAFRPDAGGTNTATAAMRLQASVI